MLSIGTVRAVGRYPVKSMAGERLAEADVEPRGIVGDRILAVYTADGRLGSGKSSHRFRRVAGRRALRATYSDGRALISLPDGGSAYADAPAIGDLLRPVLGHLSIRLGRETGMSHFDSAPLHLVTTSSIAALASAAPVAVDERRFRPNIVVDTGSANGFVENDWLGCSLRIGGSLVVEITRATKRCVMVNAAEDELPDGPLLEAIAERNDLNCGVYARVISRGTIRPGDAVSLSAYSSARPDVRSRGDSAV